MGRVGISMHLELAIDILYSLINLITSSLNFHFHKEEELPKGREN